MNVSATTMAGFSEHGKASTVGRKRVRPQFKKPTPRQKLALHLYDLAEKSGLTNAEIAKKVGCSAVAPAKWFSGENAPDVDYWPALAKALGLHDWRELLPPL